MNCDLRLTMMILFYLCTWWNSQRKIKCFQTLQQIVSYGGTRTGKQLRHDPHVAQGRNRVTMICMNPSCALRLYAWCKRHRTYYMDSVQVLRSTRCWARMLWEFLVSSSEKHHRYIYIYMYKLFIIQYFKNEVLNNEEFAVIMKDIGVGRRNISTTRIQARNTQQHFHVISHM